MAREVKSKEVKHFAFWLAVVPPVTVSLLLCCVLLFGGCEDPKAKVAGVDRVETIPAEKKKADLLELLDRKFENPDAHFELGQLYKAEGLWPKAEYHNNIALSFDPAHRQAQAAMAKVFLDSGDADKSKNYADIYMNQVAGSAGQSLELALAFQRQQLDEYALGCYRRALHLAPNAAKIHRQIGYYYLSRGDTIQAKEYLSRSFQLDPRQPDVAGELGRLGVEVRIPRKTEMHTKKLDKMIEQSGKETEKNE